MCKKIRRPLASGHRIPAHQPPWPHFLQTDEFLNAEVEPLSEATMSADNTLSSRLQTMLELQQQQMADMHATEQPTNTSWPTEGLSSDAKGRPAYFYHWIFAKLNVDEDAIHRFTNQSTAD
ncbi:hypothetical protein EMCG_07025 [[Emmonsia] crescens]|uniref:Uncharacterized protein n=1 Tax=[Emmonsia] crescens TaxID=73230 RepID=A0A0G2I9S7_9EURO|nr:hypothetical protein EMCG_07025 [Emmonsia crescens UAMH 3008]